MDGSITNADFTQGKFDFNNDNDRVAQGSKGWGALRGLMEGVGQGMMSPEFRHSYAAGKNAMDTQVHDYHSKKLMRHSEDIANMVAERHRAQQVGPNQPKLNPVGNSTADQNQIK